MDNIEKSRTKIVVPRGSNLMYDCIANSVVHLSTILDDTKRIDDAKKHINAKIEEAKKSGGRNHIVYRIGLISFNNPEDGDINPVQLELLQFYREQGHIVTLGTLPYHKEPTNYLTIEITIQSL